MPYNSDGIGWQKTDTSHQAAEDQRPTASTVRAKVLRTLQVLDQPMNADDIAKVLDLDVLTVRPRCTELRNDGKIQDSGLRTLSSRGKKMIAWEVAGESPDSL